LSCCTELGLCGAVCGVCAVRGLVVFRCPW